VHRNKFRRIEKEEENKKNKKRFAERYLPGTRQRSYLSSAFFLALCLRLFFSFDTTSIQTPQMVL